MRIHMHISHSLVYSYGFIMPLKSFCTTTAIEPPVNRIITKPKQKQTKAHIARALTHKCGFHCLFVKVRELNSYGGLNTEKRRTFHLISNKFYPNIWGCGTFTDDVMIFDSLNKYLPNWNSDPKPLKLNALLTYHKKPNEMTVFFLFLKTGNGCTIFFNLTKKIQNSREFSFFF